MDLSTTEIVISEPFGNQPVPNFTVMNAKFWGKPNFAGVVDQFGEDGRKFTLLIPNDRADELRNLGYNVKTKLATPEDREQGREDISHLKVAVDVIKQDDGRETGSQVHLLQGDKPERLTGATMGILDRARINQIDMEIRAYFYNKKLVDAGLEEPKYSARVVTAVANIQYTPLMAKYGSIL